MKRNNNHDLGGPMNTIIGRDTTIDGTLNVKGALRVDGIVSGKIICSDCVTIGTTGKVDAEIESDSAIVAGNMDGNIVATEKIELQANCHMDGDLRTKSLTIEEGAVFCGACNMKSTTPNLDFLQSGPETQDATVSEEEED